MPLATIQGVAFGDTSRAIFSDLLMSCRSYWTSLDGMQRRGP